MTEFVRLPCGHLRIKPPDRPTGVFECKHPDCGKVWKLTIKDGELTAREVEDE